MTGEDFGSAEQMDNEVEGMDMQIKEGVTLGVGSREVLKVITDKVLLVQPFPKKLNGRGITLLQTHHCRGRGMKSLKGNESIEFCERLAGRFLNEQ